MKVTTKTKDKFLIAKVKLSRGECIDSYELDSFSCAQIKGFLRIENVKRNVLEYRGPVGVSLKERLKKPVTKRDFFYIIEQIVVGTQKITAKKLSLEKVEFNLANAYINEVTREIQFLYVPVKRIAKNNVLDFLEDIVYSVQLANEDDTEYVARFIRFLKKLDSYDSNQIENYIKKEDIKVVKIIREQNVGQSGFMTDKRKDYYDHYDKKNKDLLNETPEDDATGLLDEDNTGLLEEDATGLLEEDETGLLEDETGLLQDETNLLDEEGTTVLNENTSVEPIRYPTLYRVSTQETITLNKSVFRLGKGSSSDYVITQNSAVSRIHADIVTRGYRYFIKDLGSTNFTFINNQQLDTKYEMELYDGDNIKLGNEEFIFYQ